MARRPRAASCRLSGAHGAERRRGPPAGEATLGPRAGAHLSGCSLTVAAADSTDRAVRRAALAFLAPGLLLILVTFVLPVGRVPVPQRHGLRPLLDRVGCQPPRRLAAQLHRPRARSAVLGRVRGTRCTSSSSAVRWLGRGLARRCAAAGLAPGPVQGVLPDGVLCARRDDARRRGGDLEVPLRPRRAGSRCRTAPPRAPAIDWLGSTRLGHASADPHERVEELRVQHDHLPGGIAGRARRALRRGTWSTARARGSDSGTSRCPRSPRRSSSSALRP